MDSQSLKYLSKVRLDHLYEGILDNLDRYKAGDFLDLALENGWQVESNLVQVDFSRLDELDGCNGTAKEDIKNSVIVHEALVGMTPAMAMDERIWARLSHVECLKYSRSRWLSRLEGEKLEKAVSKHMFAKGIQGARDDNAISRLWWNMHIATMIDPKEPLETLNLILLTSDYRMALVERSSTGARLPLARAIIRSLRAASWLAENTENFRQFMKELNREAGGILFEVLADSEADKMVAICVEKAKMRVG